MGDDRDDRDWPNGPPNWDLPPAAWLVLAAAAAAGLAFVVLRALRDPAAGGQHWLVRHPAESALGALVLVVVVGSVVLIAVNTARRP